MASPVTDALVAGSHWAPPKFWLPWFCSVLAIGTLGPGCPAESAIGRPTFDESGHGSVHLALGSSLDPGSLRDVGEGLTVATGLRGGQRLGELVLAVGDLDGDGIDDLAIRDMVQPNGHDRISLHSGSANPKLGPRMTFATIEGDPGSVFSAVVGTSDLNGDGFGDLAVGQLRDDGTADTAWFSGANIAGGAELNFADATTIIEGISGEQSGSTLAMLGDLDGDGLPELLAGAPRGAGLPTDEAPVGAWRGAVYLVPGALLAGGGVQQAAGLSTWIEGRSGDATIGGTVVAGGDIDGDGLPDVLLGASGSDAGGLANAGEAVLITGAQLLTPGPIAATSTSSGLRGSSSQQYCGRGLGWIRDLDGDGRDEVAVTCRGASTPDGWHGELLVFLGATWMDSTDLRTADADWTSLWNEELGIAGRIATEGDVDGDGRPDIVLGLPSSDRRRGTVAVVYGQQLVDAPGLVSVGSRISGCVEGDETGLAVAIVSDVDGDGRDEVLVGSPGSAQP